MISVRYQKTYLKHKLKVGILLYTKGIIQRTLVIFALVQIILIITHTVMEQYNKPSKLLIPVQCSVQAYFDHTPRTTIATLHISLFFLFYPDMCENSLSQTTMIILNKVHNQPTQCISVLYNTSSAHIAKTITKREVFLRYIL